jgi:hypothetical protein
MGFPLTSFFEEVVGGGRKKAVILIKSDLAFPDRRGNRDRE